MASGRLATKYGKLYAVDLGVVGEFGTKGVDDTTARNAFHKFMTNPNNEKTALYRSISHQLYFWHSVSEVRRLEYFLGYGIRPPEEFVDLILYALENGSSIPKFKRALPSTQKKEEE